MFKCDVLHSIIIVHKYSYNNKSNYYLFLKIIFINL